MKNRWSIITLLLIVSMALCYYSAHVHPWTSLKECLQNPSQFDGRVVNSYREPMIGEIYPDGFQLLQRHLPPIRVYSDTTGLKKGEYIGLVAIFRSQGYLEAITFQVAKKRREKIGLSVLPVMLVCGLFLKYYRLNRKKLQIELKENA